MALYAFDGTCNIDSDDDGEDTNVVRFKELYAGDTVEYLAGIGTRFGAVGKAVGGLFGVGGRSRIEEMQHILTENWNNGDKTIDIIGFSRGAALAVHFANQIAKDGIKTPSGDIQQVSIRFLGIWDIVGSFGLSLGNMVDFQQINLGWHIDTIADNVEHCYHAMALDERRESFGITRLDPRHRKANIEEIWFRGVHSDVGGGNNNPDRSNIALNWMLEKARASGLTFNATKSRQQKYARTDIFARISENKDLEIDQARTVEKNDVIHPSALAISLDNGASHPFIVDSALKYNWSGIRLVKGGQYRITANKDQKWDDGNMSAGPDGWATDAISWYKEPIVKAFEKNRRCPNANWFELVGTYDRDDDDSFRIGAEVSFTARQNTDLYTFANDLKTRYSNNKGVIQATIERLA